MLLQLKVVCTRCNTASPREGSGAVRFALIVTSDCDLTNTLSGIDGIDKAAQKGRADTGETPAQRREKDAKALEEKRARKAAAASDAASLAASGINTKAPTKGGGAKGKPQGK